VYYYPRRRDDVSVGGTTDMNNFKVRSPRADLRFEIAFTAAHREALKTHVHPARIEAA
jgi:hypothetical protein